MNRTLVIGVALIALAIVGMAALSGWGRGMHGPWMGPGNRPGSGWMPHMGWGPGPGAGTALPPVAGAPAVSVGMEDFRFVPAEIRLKAGQRVNLQVTNRGAILHDLVIPALRFHAEVAAAQHTTVGFIAPRAGVYEFYCSVPGHREAGMVGRLVVLP
ncbi:MAG TPA: cupredoxin domain-containing protein [bacterium]|nr:cupredoxin domain-containing protein [bacterium]